MQSVDDTAFKSLRPMLRNLVQKVHGHAGQHDPSDQEIADAIGPLLYGHVVNVPGDVQRDLLRVVVNESIQTLGWFLGIARTLGDHYVSKRHRPVRAYRSERQHDRCAPSIP